MLVINVKVINKVSVKCLLLTFVQPLSTRYLRGPVQIESRRQRRCVRYAGDMKHVMCVMHCMVCFRCRTFCLVQNMPSCLKGIEDTFLVDQAMKHHCRTSLMRSKVRSLYFPTVYIIIVRSCNDVQIN